MKNLFRSIMLVAVAATTFAGCSKDISESPGIVPEEKGFKLVITTSNEIEGADVRTEYDPAIQNIRWSGSEVLNLYSNLSVFTPTAQVEGQRATFPANLTGITSPQTIMLQGVVPAAAVMEVSNDKGIVAKDDITKTVTRMRLGIPSEQNNATIATFDPAADILVSRNLPVDLTQEDIDAGTKTVDNFTFGRPMAVTKYTFEVTNPELSADELVESVQLSIIAGEGNDKKYLTGRFYFDPEIRMFVDKDGQPIGVTSFFYQNQGFEFVKTTFAAQPKLGELAFWPITAPLTLEAGDALVFTIVTDKNTIVKTSTLANEMKFTNRVLNTANVKINEKNCVVTAKNPPVTGETAMLTEAEMKQIRDQFGSGYANFTFTNDYGIWGGRALAGLNGTYYLQVNTNASGNATGSHILTPEFNGAISQITLTLFSATSNDIHLNTAANTNNPVMTFSGSSFKTATFNLSELSEQYSQLYIVSRGVVMINNIDITYTADTTPKVVVPDDQQNFSLAYSDEAEHTFTYSARNAQLSDVTIQQDQASEDWLIIDTSTPGTVSFMAVANQTATEKTATITLSVPNGNSVNVTVKQAAAPVQLTAPADLTVTPKIQTVSASWSAVTNATEYAWRIVKTEGGVLIREDTTTELNVEISGLTASTEYTFYVKAIGDEVNYLTSTESSQTVTTLAATIPQLQMSDVTIDAAATTANSLTAQWTAVDGAASYKYTVTSGGSEVVAETSVSGTSVNIAGLSPETEYTISVMAIGDGVTYLDSAYKSVNGTTTVATAEWHAEAWSTLSQSTSSYGSGTIDGTLGSWTYTGCSGYDMAQFRTTKGLSMGRTADKSSITSPTFDNGISGIKFNYYVNKVVNSIVVTVYENGVVVSTETIKASDPAKLLSATIDVQTTGSTYFTFTPGNTDRRASVGDIEVMY